MSLQPLISGTAERNQPKGRESCPRPFLLLILRNLERSGADHPGFFVPAFPAPGICPIKNHPFGGVTSLAASASLSSCRTRQPRQKHQEQTPGTNTKPSKVITEKNHAIQPSHSSNPPLARSRAGCNASLGHPPPPGDAAVRRRERIVDRGSWIADSG